MNPAQKTAGRAAAFREEFDHAFAGPLNIGKRNFEAWICFRSGGEKLAVRTGQIAGVARRKRIQPIPTVAPGLLGITALGGVLFPVYDLGPLLGLPVAAGTDGWFLLAGGVTTPVAFLVDQMEGQVGEDVSLYEAPKPGEKPLIRIRNEPRAVIDLVRILEEVRARAERIRPAKD